MVRTKHNYGFQLNYDTSVAIRIQQWTEQYMEKFEKAKL
jgi:hypothetical protein